MEIPLTILAVYLIGMFLIGLPLGILSLKVWKYPEKYHWLRWLCFPLSTFFIEKLDKFGEEFGILQCWSSYAIPETDPHGVVETLHEVSPEAQSLRAKYIAMTMLFWFFRLGSPICGALGCFVFIVPIVLIKIVSFAVKRVANLLLKCQRCMNI